MEPCRSNQRPESNMATFPSFVHTIFRSFGAAGQHVYRISTSSHMNCKNKRNCTYVYYICVICTYIYNIYIYMCNYYTHIFRIKRKRRYFHSFNGFLWRWRRRFWPISKRTSLRRAHAVRSGRKLRSVQKERSKGKKDENKNWRKARLGKSKEENRRKLNVLQFLGMLSYGTWESNTSCTQNEIAIRSISMQTSPPSHA